MGDVVNMTDFKKRKARDAKGTKARRNRAQYGRSGAEKARGRAERKGQADEHEGKRLEKPDE